MTTSAHVRTSRGFVEGSPTSQGRPAHTRPAAEKRRPALWTLAAGAAISLTVAGIALAEGHPLPLREITLYRSGVASFERAGKVEGAATVRMRFEADQINDILKSMVLLDYGGGRIEGVSYRPNEPLAMRLEGFGVDVNAARSLEGLLGQLRGVEVRITTPEGDLEGSVLGTETRLTVVGRDGGATASMPFVNLLTSKGVRSVGINDVRALDILDEELAGELERALGVVAEHRADRWTNVDVEFNGKGERDVAVSYVLGAPVWKTSYRLVMPEGTDQQPILQGWAVVENATDEDWTDVRLTLASGRPVSFTMDLQTPLIMLRPTVAVPVLANVGSVSYESEMNQAPTSRATVARELSAQEAAKMAAAPGEMGRRLDEADSVSFDRFAGRGGVDADYLTAALAAAGEVGEQFVYTIATPVTIERQQSAMLPILGAPVEGRRVTIYAPATGTDKPMRGVEMTNNTGLHLMPGPIAVYDGGAYAGDAQIRHTSRGQERLLSYAVDVDLDVKEEPTQASDMQRLRIVDGMIEEQFLRRLTTEYTLVNRDESRARDVIIERPLEHGWDLKAPAKADEETENARRFFVALAAKETKEFTVVMERVDRSLVALTGYDIERLLRFAQSGKASQAVVDAVKKAAGMQAEAQRMERSIAEIDRETQEIGQDQDRIRRNMGSINRGDELHTRYMKKLAEQENRLETLGESRATLVEQRDAKFAELSVYLRELNVE